MNLPMRSDVAISVKKLTKTYRIFGHPADRIKQALTLGRIRFHREFTALQGVSFDVKKGEAVGIIGLNGSGKSTLLQLICGILKPTSGNVQVSGRISALLELGSGFNPEFTGRENVYFQGAVMGIPKKEMERRFDEIEAFADIGEFIDQPVRTYSSGMFVRLAFAVATHVEPDILVVDEALAVGDVLFQKRCYARIRQMQKSGLTLILVSHDPELVRNMTSRALLLGRGAALFFGDTREATHRYRKMLFEREEATRMTDKEAQLPALAPHKEDREFGIGGARIVSLRILGHDGEPRAVFHPREQIVFEIVAMMESPLEQLNISVVIRTVQGLKVYSWGTFNQDIAAWASGKEGDIFWERSFLPGEEVLVTLALEGNLGAGTYEVQTVVSRELDRQYGSQQVLQWRDEMGLFRVEMKPREYTFGGACDLRGKATFHG
jgi:lipopolysaccharide transport system ATP-binding protein